MKKEEKLLHAIGGVDERLIEEALEVRIRRKPAILRWVAVAACVCLLLVSPVGASVVGLLKEAVGLNGHSVFYTKTRFSLEDFSEEARTAAVRQERDREYYSMDDLEAAEDFLGIELPNNAVLSKAAPDIITLDVYSEDQLIETYSAPCLVELERNSGHALTSAFVWAEYMIEDGTITAKYFATTEERPDESYYGFDNKESARENYVTEAGLEAVVYSRKVDYGYGSWEVRGVLVVDKYLVSLCVYEWSEGEAITTLKTILDAYG